VQGVDFDERSVTIRHPLVGGTKQLPYDQLVIALGATTSTHGIAGADEHALPLKTLDDAVRLRDAIIGALEVAAVTGDAEEWRRLLTFVVVGGGFTGVEAAGEIAAFARASCRYYRGLRRNDLRVVLIHGGNELLEQLPPRFGERAKRMFGRLRVELVLGEEVASVDADGIALKSGKRYETRTVVWSAGVRPAPLVEQLDLQRSKHGAIVVQPDLAVPDRPGVWAVGDCAQIPKPGGGSYPQTAQHAVREGPLLADNLIASLRGKPTRRFAYRSLGMMASLGARQGLADIFGRLIAGFPAWLLWRAYYLSRLPGIDRKARVALDWTLDLPFPDDIASVR
jgi:NADH dehydrogenase